jgi:mono/diheme cytochrome c family protein
LFKKLLIAVVALGGLGLAGFGALAWQPAIAPVVPAPAGSFAPELVAKGEALAGGGYCAACHTAKGGQAFAGGYAMATPFGVIYSTNITPDPETGIGTWSEAAFRRAIHEGVSRDGSHLFPVFSYDHFTRLSDEDVRALYAYFMTSPPVHAPAQRNAIPFPFSIRYLQAGWKLLFFRPGRFEPDREKSAEWNRGAYLALGLSHCGACHTPRNLLGAEKAGEAYGGAVIRNWIAPPLTAANPAPAPWTREELYDYLRVGTSVLHGPAAGPMSPVVQGLAALPDSDIRLSMALHEGTEFVKGQVRDTNFDSYTPLRIGDVPELEIELMESIEAPVGLGEPGTTVVAPAIGNAIFAAVGVRLRDLPIRPATVREALVAQRRDTDTCGRRPIRDTHGSGRSTGASQHTC